LNNIALVNVEGSSITPQQIITPKPVNSCASNYSTGQVVCTSNDTDVYIISGTTLNSTVNSGGSQTISFSGGDCTNCGISMDPLHNRAVIALSVAGTGGYQYLNLGASPSFDPPFTSKAPTNYGANISENILIDPLRNLILSPNESSNYEIVKIAPLPPNSPPDEFPSATTPAFFEYTVPGNLELDSSGEDCTTGIALASAEFSDSSQVFIADLTQATSATGSPAGTWSAPSQVQTLTESSLSSGASGLAVAQGTHTGIVTGEFGGNAITAITLPATSGSGTPAITDWVSCNISSTFEIGYDPHTVTAYQSPNGGDAIALVSNSDATSLAVVDLTKMLNPAIVPRTTGTGNGHACTSGNLPASVVHFIALP
jgi:hypothetical protein